MEGKSVLRIKNLIAVLTCLVFAIAVLITIIIIVGFKNTVEQQTSPSAAPQTSAETTQPSTPEEQKQALDQYIAETTETIANTTNPEQTAALYMDLATGVYSRCLSFCAEYSSTILDAARQAEAAHPTKDTAWLLYNFEIIYGDEQTAAYYLDLAKTRGYDTEGAW